MGIIANTFHGDGAPLIVSLAFSGLAYSMTYALIRWLGPTFIGAGLKGKDMSKAIKKEMYGCIASSAPLTTLLTASNSPEVMGAVAASIYLLILIAFIPFPFYKDIVAATSGGGNRDVVVQVAEVETGRFLHRFPHSKVRQAPLKVVVSLNQDSLSSAFSILVRSAHPAYNDSIRDYGRYSRPPLASQSAYPCARFSTSASCILR